MMGLAGLFAEAYLRPRASARRLIDMQLPARTIVELGFLAVFLQGVLQGLVILLSMMGGTDFPDAGMFGAAAEDSASGGYAAGLGQRLLLQAGMIGAVAGIAHGLGRLVGGKGRFRGVATVVVWHTVITAPLAAVQVLAFLGAGNAVVSGLIVLFLVLGLYGVWLLACFISEAHAFRSVLPVALSMVGIALVASFLFGISLQPV